MEKAFTINANDMASLLLLNVSLCEVIERGEVNDDILGEFRMLQPKIERIVSNA